MKKKTNSIVAFLQTKRGLVALGAVIIILGFGGGLLLSQNASTQTKSYQTTNCDGVCVAVFDGKADPDTLAVTAGSFIQFNNADGKKHNLVLGSNSHHDSGDLSAEASGDFGAGEAWRVQFKKDGTYQFTDKYNDKLKILVVVYTEGKDYKVTR